MADDPYQTLGLTRTASDDDVRRAFRKLAKELHPDVNPNNAAAAERFKKVSQAYDVLGDAEKRKKFDRGEIGADGEPRRAYAGAGAGPFGYARPPRPGQRPAGDDLGFGDIFSEFFREGGYSRGGGFASRGQDSRYTLEIEFRDAIHGARKRVTMPSGAVLDISVPEGVGDGQVLRLKGKGAPGSGGGEPGDALVEIKVKPDQNFTREGDTIRSTVAISIDEAVLGAKIPVETVSGPVSVSVPKGTSSGRVLRLRGKGARSRPGAQPGDHLVTLQIVLPDPIDESLAYFLAEWRQSHGYDPRKA
ncbi:MAG: DnaJ C-terminal domain-containing protein [Hyphomicrobiaceae bacterium]